MNSHIHSADIIAILPAAGIGRRMQSELPKQYLTINNKTIIEHSIAALLRQQAIQKVMVGLHPQDTIFSTLAISHDPRIETFIGGDTRALTVLAGLEHTVGYQWVLVHDAARPCLRQEDLNQLLLVALTSAQGAILAAPVRDTMKQSVIGEETISHTVDREYLWHALTPQMFPLELLKMCLIRGLNEGASITDEASALEYCGFHPRLINASADNIKITCPEDLALARFYLTDQI